MYIYMCNVKPLGKVIPKMRDLGWGPTFWECPQLVNLSPCKAQGKGYHEPKAYRDHKVWRWMCKHPLLKSKWDPTPKSKERSILLLRSRPNMLPLS
jgi:hypothetical protein